MSSSFPFVPVKQCVGLDEASLPCLDALHWTVEVPAQQLQTSFAYLQTILQRFANGEEVRFSCEDAYNRASYLCDNGYSEQIYNGFCDAAKARGVLARKSTEEFMSSRNGNENGTTFPQFLESQWTTFQSQFRLLRDVLMGVDRTFVVQSRVPPLMDMALSCFREQVFATPQVQSLVTQYFLGLVQTERELFAPSLQITEESLPTRDLLIRFTSLFKTQSAKSEIYSSVIAEPFLHASQSYHIQLVRAAWNTNNLATYIERAYGWLEAETDKCRRYLEPAVGKRLINGLNQLWLEDRKEDIFSLSESTGSLETLVETGGVQMQRLNQFYILWSRVPEGAKILCAQFGLCIKSQANRVLEQFETQKQKQVLQGSQLIAELLKLEKTWHSTVTEAFNGDGVFRDMVSRVKSTVFNSTHLVAEGLAAYLDAALQTARNVQSSADETVTDRDKVSQDIEKCLDLFRLFDDRDIFERFYREYTCQRLLNSRNGPEELEVEVLSRIKGECGTDFTAHLEHMYTDLKLFADVMNQFRKWALDRSDLGAGTGSVGSGVNIDGVELEVQVLTANSWPTSIMPKENIARDATQEDRDRSAVNQFLLSSELSSCCMVFKEFYKQLHSGRKLIWNTNLGSALIRFNLGSIHRELLVSTGQACILLLFNGSPSYSFEDIKSHLGVSDIECRRHLLPLVAAKHPVLVADSSVSWTNELPDLTGKLLQINNQFNSKKVRTQIQVLPANVVSSTVKDATTATVETAHEDRKPIVEACIVRVMKAKKRLEHNGLVAEVVNQLRTRFHIEPSVIKARIESLIEREFLERDKDDKRTYKYLA